MAYTNGITTNFEAADIAAQARAAVRAEALSILETCAVAGLTSRDALRYIKAGATAESVRAALLAGGNPLSSHDGGEEQ